MHTHPTRSFVAGRPVWRFPNGRTLPVVAGAADADPPPADPPADPPGDRTFTQAELDRIVQERIARVKAEPPADYEDLKAAKARLDELEQQSMSDLEKLQQQLAERDQALADRDQQLQEITTRAQQAAIRADVVAHATRLGAVDPDAVMAMLPPDAVTIGDDGQVTGTEAAVQALLDAKPYLVGKPAPPAPGGADGGVRGRTPSSITREDLKTMTPEQITEALHRGDLVHLLTG